MIQDIQRQLDAGVSWRLPVDRIPPMLDIDHTEFYRRVYAAVQRPGGTVEYSTLTQTFDQESVGELVELLELFSGSRAEEAFTEFGAFIPHPLRVELTSVLFETARIEAREHSVDGDAFRAMLRVFGTYESARDTYLNEYFTLDRVVRLTCERFVRDHEFRSPELALQSSAAALKRLFDSRILELQTVFVSVALALFDIAVEAGYARRHAEDSSDAENERKNDDTDSLLSWACSVLELRSGTEDESIVKRAYKRLMLQYHPDVNPRGLHKAKEINRAYSIIVACQRLT